MAGASEQYCSREIEPLLSVRYSSFAMIFYFVVLWMKETFDLIERLILRYRSPADSFHHQYLIDSHQYTSVPFQTFGH